MAGPRGAPAAGRRAVAAVKPGWGGAAGVGRYESQAAAADRRPFATGADAAATACSSARGPAARAQADFGPEAAGAQSGRRVQQLTWRDVVPHNHQLDPEEPEWGAGRDGGGRGRGGP
jgi:hypothetical protein